jgi:hypothetical protein
MAFEGKGRQMQNVGDNRLDRLSRSELRGLWTDELGEAPPMSIGRDVLALVTSTGFFTLAAERNLDVDLHVDETKDESARVGVTAMMAVPIIINAIVKLRPALRPRRSAKSPRTTAPSGAITFSQTLGTALGDWMADSTGLGYEGGALVFAAGLVALAAAYFWTNVSRVFLFWAAFILTRPPGATVGDLLDKPVNHGGLALSRPIASAVIAAFILACILLLPQRAWSKRNHSRPCWRTLSGCATPSSAISFMTEKRFNAALHRASFPPYALTPRPDLSH